jgi:hypothetical protein
VCATSAGLGKTPAQDPLLTSCEPQTRNRGLRYISCHSQKVGGLSGGSAAEFEKARTLRYPSNHFFLSWAISSATLELGPTGSIKTMCLALRYTTFR